MSVLSDGDPRRRAFLRSSIVIAVLCAGLVDLAQAAGDPSPIEFREDLVKILDRADVAWDGSAIDEHDFASVQSNADGSHVLFNVLCEWCSAGTGPKNRIFLATDRGAQVEEISDLLYPPDIVSTWWGWGSLRLNDDASLVVLRAQLQSGEHHWLVYETASGQVGDATQNPFRNLSATLDDLGARLYFTPYDAGWDETLQRRRMGLFFADLGAGRQQYLDIVDLPCSLADCANTTSAVNLLNLVGSSATSDHVFFAWNDAWGASDNWALYRGGPGHPVEPLGSLQHNWVERDLNPRGFCSADGRRALYEYIHRAGDPVTLSVVDMASGSELPLAWNRSFSGFDPIMSRDGRYVLVSGPSGDLGGYLYRTLFDLEHLFDLQQLSQRDTGSARLPSAAVAVSNLTADAQHYFLAYADSLYRVDLMPAVASVAPRVTQIRWSARSLLDDPDARIGVEVVLSDDQGVASIDRVIMLPLIEGRESPDWGMGRGPLAYPGGVPGGDVGYEVLFDDGTHGDTTPGDGVFTFYAIATRQSGREDGWNAWFLQVDLPAYLGARFVALDDEGHYSITDSRLLITDAACVLGPLAVATPVTSGVGHVRSATGLYTQGVVAVEPEAEALFEAGTFIRLSRGFHVKPGAVFRAVVDAGVCAELRL
ncbi:choice-of-anchor X domain-containing protein [Thiocystis violacea]|uniref:choice-of-anchor X domain-containing protein n=1 Tax=Thiocystis violacea TaxID=13725 RepID=UPI001905249B|nr:choice-of-anchor X domain-containing protein [Thiocystis violacea]MBK1722916.1 hypothetical protein [Thiocystis violacea]